MLDSSVPGSQTSARRRVANHLKSIPLASLAAVHPPLGKTARKRSGQDLLTLSLWDHETLVKLGLDGSEHEATRTKLRGYQRLGRLGIEPSRADALFAAGLSSAQHIASLPRARFIRDYAKSLGSAEDAREIHEQARSTQARVSHAWARLRDQLAPHLRNNRYLRPSDDLLATVSNLPGYTDLFGSLDYMAVPDCQSVLSPSAYFVDLMRVIEESITSENPHIPAEYVLKKRRPDLYSTELTCANALTSTPTIDIINQVISTRLQPALGSDVDYAIATRVFPFFLPLNVHLLGLRATLIVDGASLATVYREFQAQPGGMANLPKPLNVASEQLGLSAEQFAIITTPIVDAAILGQYYGLPAGSSKPSPVQLPVSIGTVSAVVDKFTLTGTGFTSSLVGWVVNVAGTLRVVNSVDSATQLTVDSAWPANQNNVPALAYPPQSVAQLSVFSSITGLPTKLVYTLLQQNLSSEELAKSLGKNFYINTGNAGGAVISITSDTSDANYSLDVLENLSLDNLDRCNRFLRLAAASGWNTTDLDWAIRAIPLDKIDDGTVLYLSQLSGLMSRLSLPVDETCGLFAPLKTYGRGSDANPADLFDRVFNSTRVHADRAPYRPIYAPNPLFTSPVLNWSVDADDNDNRRIQAWLAGSLQLSEADLRLLVDRIGGTSPIALDVPTLSRFYADARLARTLKLKITSLFQALDLSAINKLDGIKSVIALVAFKDAADQAGLTLNDIGYIIGGPIIGKLPGTLDPNSVPPFLETLRTLGKSWLLKDDSFVFDNIDAARSAEILKQLVGAGIVDAEGVMVMNVPPEFTTVAPFFPVTPAILFTPPLSESDAQKAWTDLGTHGVLNGNILVAPVHEDTDLSYLFTGDPDQKAKIDAVQDVLLSVSSDATHTQSVLADARAEQALGAYTQLALLLQDDVDLTQAVAELTLGELGNPLQLLLTVQGDRLAVVDAIVRADRLAYAAAKLGINAVDMGIACRIPGAFDFGDLAHPGLEDLGLLSLYARLLKAFGTTGFMLAGYLLAPILDPPYVKMQALQTITGWPVAQSTALVAALWGKSDGYNNLAGLDLMRICFNRAAGFGVEIPSVLALAQSASYVRMPLPTLSGGDSATWGKWVRLAQAALDVLKAKYGDAAWNEMSQPVHDAVADARRRSLVALAVLLLGPDIPSIDSPRTLSEYLLLDVESCSCNVTTPILGTTLAAQMYLQRCRMALEPGVTSADISDLTWSWLSSYRLWEANRKIFIYPESYIDPSLRRPRTPLFTTLLDQLQQDEITDAAVTNAFTQYLNSFDELAKLQNVDSVYCVAPDPDTGENVEQLVMIGRTAGEPYSYFSRTMEDGEIWSAWQPIDMEIPVSTVTPVFAYGRLFLFWVETEETSTGFIENSTQKTTTSMRASIRYAFQRLDKTWTAPQPVLSGVVFDASPNTYSTSLVNPSSDDPLAGIDVEQPYWYRPYVVVVPGKAGMPDQLVVAFGNAYASVTTASLKPPTPGVAPSVNQLNDSIYNASLLANATATANPTGSVQLMPVAVLDNNLEITEAWGFLANSNVGPQPFGATAYQRTFVLIPSQNVLVDNMLSEASDYYDRVYKGGVTGTCLYSLSRQAIVTPVENMPGWWIFNNGDEAFLAVTTEVTLKKISDIVSLALNAIPLSTGANEVSLSCGAYSPDPISVQDAVVQFTRLTTGAMARMNRTLFAGGIEALLSNATQVAPGPGSLCFTRFYTKSPVIAATCDPHSVTPPPPANTIPPQVLCGGQVDFYGAYRPYFEEIFFQIPFLLASMLNANQRFAEAKRWYDFIFDPTAAVTQPDPVEPAVFWQYQPFREETTVPSLAQILSDNTAILRWNKHPFDPFSVAALRPSAYKKTIVMHYIDNLLDWGDQQFALDTRESLNQALLLYLMAYDLLGPAPRERGVMPTPTPINFQDILDAYGDDIPQFLIELENALPQAPAPLFQYNPAPFNLLDTYFGVGENADFMAYWTRVDDRLYKLRNCMNINGDVRQLPFFQPPIDPNVVVAAIGKGAQLPTVVDHSPAAAPNYRFSTMLDRAKSITQTLIGFGGSLLGALEKKDGEQLALLRTGQERAVLKLTTLLKEQQVIDAQESVASLQTSYESAAYRYGYYAALHDDGLSAAEAVNIAMLALANIFQTQSGIASAGASIAALLPNAGSPFAMTYGGVQLSAFGEAISKVYETISNNFDFAATLSSVLAGYQRRDQEWVMQRQLASYEKTQLQSQIVGAQTRLAMAQRDVQINSLQITQANDTELLLLNKFSSEELYNWMAVRMSVIYFQTYKLAFDLAMAAQRAYQYEMNSGSTFIDFGYWDSGRKGMLAGEGLLLSLSQMENNFLAGNSLRLNVSKSISLREMNPQALVKLQSEGRCNFELSELLFDLDFPGQYCRKIERINISIPGVVGPRQNLCGILTQTGNTVVIKPDPEAVAFLLGQDPTTSVDNSLRLNWRANQQIALSQGTEDNGMAGTGSGDRYAPFEGTGAVSQWTLELPQRNNSFDLDSISDVIIQLTYSALSGGVKFRGDVQKLLPTDVAGARLIQLSQYSAAWQAFMNPGPTDPSQDLVFPVPRSLFPFSLGSDITLTGAYLQLLVANTSFVGPMPVTLTVPSVANPVALTFPKNNTSTSTTFSTELDPAAPWSFKVKRSDIPAELKLGDQLDPARLVGIYLLLTYTGDVS
jgi:hypothetical protein